jgi:hypothetical protein
MVRDEKTILQNFGTKKSLLVQPPRMFRARVDVDPPRLAVGDTGGEISVLRSTVLIRNHAPR